MLSFKLHKEFVSKKRKVNIQCEAHLPLGEVTAIYGKSGIGKSTVLRMLVGLEKPNSGEIQWNEHLWYSSNKKIDLPIAERELAVVFQDFNLFPNMTVEGNLKYASENGVIDSHILEMMNKLDLEQLLSSYPDELSGGQQQRVAIFRSLCQKPKLLLLDEPFSALDDDAIGELIHEIELIRKTYGTTILLVTHRKDVVFKIAKNVLLLKEDDKAILGTPQELLERTL